MQSNISVIEKLRFFAFGWSDLQKLILDEGFRGRELHPPIPYEKPDLDIGSRAPGTIRKHVFQRSKIFGLGRPGPKISDLWKTCFLMVPGALDPINKSGFS